MAFIRCSTLVLAVVAATSWPDFARAQEPGPVPADTLHQEPAARPTARRNDPVLVGVTTTLLPLAGGVTLVAGGRPEGLLLLGAGVTIGPAVALSVAGRPGRAWAGVGLRVLLAVGGFAGAWAACGMNCSSTSDQADGARLIMYGGLTLAGISAIHDIALAGRPRR